MNNNEIKSLEDLEVALLDIIYNPEKASMTDIERLKNLTIEPIQIHVSDSEHGNALSASMLKIFTEYQDSVYKAVKIAKYGNVNCRLSSEDKAGFELYIKFKEGSVLAEIDWQAIIQRAVEAMNGWQIFGLIAIGTLVYGAYKGFKVFSDNKRLDAEAYREMQIKVAEIDARTENSRQQAKTVSEIAALANETNKTTVSMLKELSRISGTVSINGKNYQRGELVELANETRNEFTGEKPQTDDEQEIPMKHVSGKFLVSRIDLDIDDPIKEVQKRTVNLVNVDTNEIFKNVPITGKNLSDEQKEIFTKAVDGTPIELEMVVAYSDTDKIKSICVLKCNGIVFREPELF